MKTNKFKSFTTKFELLDAIRVRHQMYASSIEALSGILTGFSIAQNITDEEFDGFHRFLAKKLNKKYNYYSWMELIESVSEDKEYEVSIFYKFLDEFRCTKNKIIAEVNLTYDQRRFDFDRRIVHVNIDKPCLPLKAPDKMIAIELNSDRVYAFYYDNENIKYFEQYLGDKEDLFKWAKNCYDIPSKQWKLNP